MMVMSSFWFPKPGEPKAGLWVPFVRAPGTLFEDSRALRELLEQAARPVSEHDR